MLICCLISCSFFVLCQDFKVCRHGLRSRDPLWENCSFSRYINYHLKSHIQGVTSKRFLSGSQNLSFFLKLCLDFEYVPAPCRCWFCPQQNQGNCIKAHGTPNVPCDLPSQPIDILYYSDHADVTGCIPIGAA